MVPAVMTGSSTTDFDVQALILAGGEGTRLRPLTSNTPKPVVPLVDRPFIVFMLDWLRRHSVDDVVMSCGHLATAYATSWVTARSSGCGCATWKSHTPWERAGR